MVNCISSQNGLSASLVGTWTIDLTPEPSAEPYFQEMEIALTDDNSFKGSFYNTSFDNGEISTVWGVPYFAFSTKAGKSVYFTSGYFDEDGEMRGLTYCDNRDFVAHWKGYRKEEITK